MPLYVSVLLYVIAVVLAVATVVGNVYALKYSDLISVHFGENTSKVVSTGKKPAVQFNAKYTSEAQRETALEHFGTQISQEGITLLKNEHNTLPLNKGAKISVLGQDSVDPVYGGGGAGSVDTKKAISLTKSLKDAGFDLNQKLTDFYTNGAGKPYRKTNLDAYGKGKLSVNEVPASAYTDDVKNSFTQYNDAALVVIGRSGGESSDLSMKKLDTGSTYLSLDKNEKDMLAMAQANFKKIVVLLNTQNPMELGPLDDYSNIDSVVWIGSLGQTGAPAVGQVLNGTVNPSGHLPDTYAYDSQGAPSVANSGSTSIANSKDPFGRAYMVYAEGVYVGYRYYETRYEDKVLGTANVGDYDYAKQVEYPFGYGLSYTTFKQGNPTMREDGKNLQFSVPVTNTGKRAGKDTVQIYMQSPYTSYDKSNGIEKPSVQLVGYAKTNTLKPGASQSVNVSVPKESMKSYDAKGKGTYILDAGDYYFASGSNAHAALNNILAAKGKTQAAGMDANGEAAKAVKKTVGATDSRTYSTSQSTGSKITNQFADADIQKYEPQFKYLSRSDWTGTWPKTFSNGSWTAPESFTKALAIDTKQSDPASKPQVGVQSSKYGKLNVAMLAHAKASDPAWNALISQMSAKELDELVRIGGYATKPVKSIGLPATVDKDGPAGISSTLVGGKNGMGYPTEVVVGATWNPQIAREYGEMIGEDSLALGVTVWYAPGCGIHRSPYGGRAFEYFSEDPYLSGEMTAGVVAGAASKGVVSTVKHFALNDQETNRMGGAMFANEQAIREVYLKPFEIAVRQGGATGVMVSMNRIGARWTGGDKGLMTNTLRDEWGFNGLAVTDQASYSVFAYEDMREGLEAGTDLWLNTDAKLWKVPDDQVNDGLTANRQRAAKHIVYAFSRSNAMNGISVDSKVVAVTPLWRWALYVFDVLIALLAIGLCFIATRGLVRRRRNKTHVTIEPKQ